MARYIDTAEVAKLLRAELKAHFPDTRFSVRISRYAGGSSIDVYWIEGPGEEVTPILQQFQGASFDGMIDLKSYHSSEWHGEPVHFGSDYVFGHRLTREDAARGYYPIKLP